ncbi:MAG: hypothetical protein MJ097_07835 [Dorea sp.]|nr:hypothetical protein [Dorea sp.]
MKSIHPFVSKDDHTLKDVKDLPFKKRMEHIFIYYKLPIFIVLLVIYIISYSAYRKATEEIPVIYTGFINLSMGDDLHKHLTEDYITDREFPSKRNVVRTYDDLFLAEKPSAEEQPYVYASQLKILAAIDAEQLDVVLMTQDVFDSFSQNGYLINLEDFIGQKDPALYESLGSDLIENLEILWDNTDEVMADRTVPYQSETTTYLMGIDVSDFPCIKEAGFGESVYLGILKNTPREDVVLDYIHYISEK